MKLIPMLRSAAFLALLTCQLVAPVRAASQDATEPRAYVGNRDALFVFPVPDRDTWHWFRPETNPGTLEYGWTIELATAPRYRFGYSLYKPGAAAVADSGSLEELLRRGQRTLWVADATSGGLKAAPPVDLQFTAMNGQLLLHLNDEDVVAMLFDGTPERVRYEVVLGGTRWAGGDIPVQYTRSDRKLWSGADNADAPAVGAMAPGFDLPILGASSTTGRFHSSDLVGEVTVLYFWSSHCPVSRGEFEPVMKRARHWLQRGVRFVGVTTRQDPATDRAFLAAHPTEDIVHLVASSDMERSYGAWGTPYVVLIDAEGRVAYRAMSAGQWSEGGILQRKLDRLLEQRSARSKSGS